MNTLPKFQFSLLFLANLLPVLCFSQNTISGKLINENSEAISYANILLLQEQDSSFVKGDLTKEDGSFKIDNIQNGNYLINFSFIGYEEKYSEAIVFESSREDLILEDQVLKQNSIALDEVQVTAHKPLFEQSIDRLVVNVQNSVTAAGSNALEILARSPGVIVNEQSGNISLAGKTGVVLMINGKINYMPIEAAMQILQGMSADNIEKIELITNPPANYDAQGDAGFINIVLKKRSDLGLNGSLAMMMGYGDDETSSANLNFNYRKGKVNLFGSYSFLREYRHFILDNYRMVEHNDRVIEGKTYSDRVPLFLNHNLRLGFDYELNEKTILGGLVSTYKNGVHVTSKNDYELLVNQNTDTIVSTQEEGNNDWHHMMGNVNLQHKFKKEGQLNIDVDYLFYKNKNALNYVSSFEDSYNTPLFEQQIRTNKTTPLKILVSKMDVSKRLGEKIQFQTGLKATLSNFNDNVRVEELFGQVWERNPDFSAQFRLLENIGAAYTSFDIQLSDKTNVKAGLRYEYTHSNLGSPETANILDRNYGNFFPNLMLSQTINENNSLNLSYNRRITRPTFKDIAPFVLFTDPNTFFTGNPTLLPAITDAVRLGYRFKTILFAVGYSFEKNAIANFQSRVDPVSNKQTIFTENLDNRKTIDLMLAMPVYVKDWWSMQNNIMAIRQEVNETIDEELVKVKQNNFRIASTQTFKLSGSLTLELSGFYQSAGLFGTAKLGSFGELNLGLQKKLKGDHGAFNFTVSNIFDSTKLWYDLNIPDSHLVINGVFDYGQRRFKITYTRSFGNKKLKASRNRQTGSAEEQIRARNN